MINDLRYALRSLHRAPGFTTAAVLTLGLGIGINTIAFTLVNSLLLRPMPVRDADRVVRLFPADTQGQPRNLFSYPDYVDYREQARGFDVLAAYMPAAVTLGGDGQTRESLAYAVSSNYFDLLGLVPSVGRGLLPSEETAPGASDVAVVSHTFWKRELQSASDAIGSRVAINGHPFTIVGVGPAEFRGTEPLAPEVWVPLSAQRAILPALDRVDDRKTAWLLVVGRLAPGAHRAGAAATLDLITRRLAAAYPDVSRHASVQVARGTFFSPGPGVRPVITLVMSILGLVLVIACANIANLTLVRALSRARELAVRVALGAGRWRVVRHLVLESAVIGVLGGAVGLLLSAWTLRVLYPVGLSMLPFQWAPVVLDLTPDARVFGYALCLAIAASCLFGLAPVVPLTHPAIASGVRGEGRFFGLGVGSGSLRRALVVVQVAVCLVLLGCAALTARALQRTESLALGFRAAGVVYTAADLRRHGYTALAASELRQRLVDRARVLPGVEAMAFTTHVPLTGGVKRASVRPEGHDPSSATFCTHTAISSDYFRTLEIPFVSGRDFTAAEAASGAPVAIVSEALARRFWPGERAPGKLVAVAGATVPLTVVGVVRDATDVAIWREKQIALYVPAGGTRLDLHLVVRTSGDGLALARALQAEARDYDERLVFEASTLDHVLRMWILPSRIAAIAAAVLGGIALILAAAGVYGVTAFGVAQRRRELAIRVAIGARARDVVGLVVVEGGRLAAIGIGVGLGGAFAAAGLLASVLPGAEALDPVPLGGAAVFLAIVVLGACYLAARRAAAVDPLTSLGAE